MAQTQSPTNFAYSLIASLLNANAMYVAVDNGVMTSYGVNTNIMGSEVNVSGFGRQAGTRNIINTNAALLDTAQIYYLYTANANQNINGHVIVNNTTNGNGNYNILGWCAYAATQPMLVADTVNCVTQFQCGLGTW
jgi:hypothetical protein